MPKAKQVRVIERPGPLFPEGVRSLITQRHELDDAPAAISARGGIKQVVHLADPGRS